VVFGECTVNDGYTLAGCRRLFEKLAAKGVWQTPTMAFFETAPDVFSGRPLDHAEYASDSLFKLTRDNVENSRVPAGTLETMRLAGQISLQVLPDMYSLGNRFLAATSLDAADPDARAGMPDEPPSVELSTAIRTKRAARQIGPNAPGGRDVAGNPGASAPGRT
jgi:hypothetical protein